jgi:hypothetical protein
MPTDMPEQRPADMNAVVETRKEFEAAIKQTMHRIAIDTYNESSQPENYRDTLDQAYEKYFNSMKGATNIHPEDVHRLIEAETRRQKALYKRIEELKPHFNTVKPLDPSHIYAIPFWDHSPSPGVTVEINNTRFYAAPRVPCSAKDYVTVKQAPVPANIVYINHDMILMLPYWENTTEETHRQLNQLLDASGTVTEEEITAPIHVKKNYLWVHSETKIDQRVIENLMTKYGADAFMVGYPARNIAIIYTGLEESIERLWKTVYFDGDEMWKRYGWDE